MSRSAPDGMDRGARLAAAASLAAQLVLAEGYAVATLAWLDAPASDFARRLEPWRAFLGRSLAPAIDAMGGAPCRPPSAIATTLYREYLQLVVLDLGVAVAVYLACAPYWLDWGRSLRSHRRWAGADASRVETELEIGQGLALAGLAAAGWFLVAAPYPAASCLGPDPWLFLRAPLVIALAYGLICFATAFGFARTASPGTDGDPPV